jgi:hypothetical protein
MQDKEDQEAFRDANRASAQYPRITAQASLAAQITSRLEHNSDPVNLSVFKKILSQPTAHNVVVGPEGFEPSTFGFPLQKLFIPHSGQQTQIMLSGARRHPRLDHGPFHAKHG